MAIISGFSPSSANSKYFSYQVTSAARLVRCSVSFCIIPYCKNRFGGLSAGYRRQIPQHISTYILLCAPLKGMAVSVVGARKGKGVCPLAAADLSRVWHFGLHFALKQYTYLSNACFVRSRSNHSWAQRARQLGWRAACDTTTKPFSEGISCKYTPLAFNLQAISCNSLYKASCMS